MVDKVFTTISQQLELLSARGMSLDRDEASAWLEHVGYYRLSGYWYPYRLPSDEPKQRLDHFVATASFHDVALLYEFDRKLRGLVFDGIERLEVALRAALSAHVGAISPLAYLEPDTFRSSFKFESWLETVNKRIERATAFPVFRGVGFDLPGYSTLFADRPIFSRHGYRNGTAIRTAGNRRNPHLPSAFQG